MQGKKVRLVGTEEEIITYEEASNRAYEEGLDLVMVAEKSDPPVVRLMNYGKFLYEKNKKLKEQRKKSSQQKNKEVKFRVNIDQHDYEIKVKHIIEFLEKGYKVKVSLFLRGRENAHRELGLERLKQVIEDVAHLATVDSPPRYMGRNASAQLTPIGHVK
ncbi:MAG: translation initiation factor IF-3 [Lentisphaeria bacterium]|nr:translation initiation factor IF-3 [Lentisphaeria bacterium]NQZ71105.1 translation initiation factor IF-3 [Lentisphaeria bacterium]